MHISDSFKTALVGLKTNKSRTALTILGIVIGITAIIIVMGVGAGAENLILNQMQGFGANTVVVQAGRKAAGPSSFMEMMTDSLRQRDVDVIKKIPEVTKVSPGVFDIASINYENKVRRSPIYGSSDLILEIMNLGVNQGTFFDQQHIDQRARVAVIGSEISDDFFGFANPLGKKIRIKNNTFQVIGVMDKKGSVMGLNIDEMVFVPYSSAQSYLLGINHFNDGITVQIESKDDVSRVVAEIEHRLRDLHGITDPDKDDFHVMTQEEVMDTIGMITSILTALLGSVAAISLIVGGIGIMNIMLVSVTERTREIGLRKAVGATTGDIMTQFVLESIILTILGGILGVGFGALFSYLASLILSATVAQGWSFVMPIEAVILGIGVSAFVGLVFGLYPAKQASKKSPIEALRYE